MRFLRTSLSMLMFVPILMAQAVPGKEPSVTKDPQVELQSLIQEATKSPSEILLFALDPSKGSNLRTSAESFHGWSILGKKAVSASANADALASAIEKEYKPVYIVGGGGRFLPHYGLRFQFGGKSLDLILYYDMHAIEGYFEGKDFGPFHSSGSSMEVVKAAFRVAGLPSEK